MIYKLHVTEDILQDVFAHLTQCYYGRDIIHLVMNGQTIKLDQFMIAAKCAIFQWMLQSLKIQYEVVES